MSVDKIVVHNLEPMTGLELSKISCGHCRHQLSWHVTGRIGLTQCAICSCLRTRGEDIREPHHFTQRETS